MRFEYKIIPAPARADKVKGVKTRPERFARTVESAMNDLAAEGWEYLRADTLPCEERKGLTGSSTGFQTVLVFRRPHSGDGESEPATAPDMPVIRALRPVSETQPDTDSEPHVAEPELADEAAPEASNDVEAVRPRD